ncbi:MAG: NUDIX domain-containing protein [Polyangiaceae bacterium]|nr:NUDIX domain-containing protein [Polyangiaceae bacterium]
MTDELFPIVDEQGQVIGSAPRGQVHGNPKLLHPVVHCLVTNSRGELLLQRRCLDKDIQPGRWDTSVGGHVAFGESIEHALRREMKEEVGLELEETNLTFLYRYVHTNPVESELVYTFSYVSEGPFVRQVEEIDELRFFGREELDRALGTGMFTPNFEEELARYREATAAP